MSSCHHGFIALIPENALSGRSLKPLSTQNTKFHISTLYYRALIVQIAREIYVVYTIK